MKISRRDFLRIGAASLLTPYLIFSGDSHTTSAQSSAIPPEDLHWFNFNPANQPQTVFGLSVASGDPTPSGVILWTRINLDQWQPNTKLAFEIAEDESFQTVVARGLALSEAFNPNRDCTVKLDLDGTLLPNKRYFYRFIYNGTASRTGRCRTLPTQDQAINSVRFGVLTCQDFTNGYYGAFHHLAQENIDFVVHLGDFIYESAADPRFQSLPFADRGIILPSGGTVSLGLEDFRFIYRRYRSDRFLQRAMEQHTWITIWDDHETCNDCYWDYARNCLGAPDHPFTTQAQYGNNPVLLNGLKLAAQRAWLEYIPARITANESATHPHEFMSIYRKFKFGSLVELFMTDERTYRSSHPCGENSETGGLGARTITTGCDAQSDQSRTMLGQTQRDWLTSGIINSQALWKVWGNEVFTAPLKLGPVFFNLDAWDGYEAERKIIMQRLLNASVKNFVVLTGDLHTYMASYLKVNYSIPQNSDNFLGIHIRNMVGVEFMTPSVTSSNLKELLDGAYPADNINEAIIRLNNPHIRFFNSERWGYSVVEFTRSQCLYTAYDISKSQNSESVAKRILRRLVVPVNQIKLLNA